MVFSIWIRKLCVIFTEPFSGNMDPANATTGSVKELKGTVADPVNVSQYTANTPSIGAAVELYAT